MMMSTKQSLIHNETIWKSTYLRNFLSLDLVNWSINIETGESCCLKWSFSLTLCEIPWRFSSILPNVKTSLTLCKIPWQFPDLEKFYFSLTFPWRLWTLTILNFMCRGHADIWSHPDHYKPSIHPTVVTIPGISLGLRPTNGRRRYNVTTSLIGWAHT